MSGWQDSTIHVVLASDEKYAMPMSVVICSAAFNCAPDRLLRFHIIESGFSEESKQRVHRSLTGVRSRNAQIDWYPVAMKSIADLTIVHSHMNSLIYARLLAPRLLPPDVDWALYIDSDVVVEGDVSELWDAYKSEKSLSAVRDRIGLVSQPGGLINFEQLGIDPGTPYFNSGVMLINVARWREQSISEKVFSYLRSHGHLLQAGDQDGLNAILHNDWLEIPGRWNQQIVPRALRGGSDVALPNRVEGGILHFITGEKPWAPGCEYIERQHFYDCLDKTDWRGWRIPLWRESYFLSRRALGKLRRSIIPATSS